MYIELAFEDTIYHPIKNTRNSIKCVHRILGDFMRT